MAAAFALLVATALALLVAATLTISLSVALALAMAILLREILSVKTLVQLLLASLANTLHLTGKL